MLQFAANDVNKLGVLGAVVAAGHETFGDHCDDEVA